VEHFDDDFAELVSILNARPGVPSLPPVQPVKANYNASPCDAHHRKLFWQLRNGTENPCDKMELYQGQHSHCYTSITKFYADDLALLM
jgi:GH25 family lysozyme M1 (1,4-beta-N-acetylmuramidase)